MMLSEQIKRGRNALGMSQADLAEAIWVSRNTVCNWETGATTPDIQSLVLMSALFGVSVDEMVKGDDKVMAQAVARDRRHILLAGPLMQSDPESAEPKLSLFDLNAIGSSVYQVRMEGFKRVQLSQEVRMDNGFKDVIRFDGEGITVSGNLMGDDFAIQREGAQIASVQVRPAHNRVAYGIELAGDETAPLALGIVLTIMMLRNYDQVWVRGSARRKMPSQ